MPFTFESSFDPLTFLLQAFYCDCDIVLFVELPAGFPCRKMAARGWPVT